MLRRRRLILKRRQGEAIDLETSDGLVTILVSELKNKYVTLVFLAPELTKIGRDIYHTTEAGVGEEGDGQ